jgi:hypothetical protein
MEETDINGSTVITTVEEGVGQGPRAIVVRADKEVEQTEIRGIPVHPRREVVVGVE